MKVSVILPTFDEVGNIVALVRAIQEHIPAAWEREVIVVDDDSPDGTYAAVREAFAGDPTVVPVLRTRNPGLAASIRAGLELACGDRVVVMDTDFTHDPVELPRMLRVSEVYDLVSGSRFCPGGSMQDTKHYLASLAYNWCLRLLLRTQVQDNLGGYFVMHREQLLQLPFDQIFFGYGDYFFRLLHYAQKRGMSIVEVPAQYRARVAGVSKSSFLKMLYGYTRSGLALRLASAREPRREGQ
jgi:dolichol-phosphate mannosyltransferase